jgi:hypothetical protein
MSNIRHNHQLDSVINALPPDTAKRSGASLISPHLHQLPPDTAKRSGASLLFKKQPPKPTLAIIQGGGCRQIESATGVLQALDEANIHINQYRAASAGAIVAALHASGFNGKAIAHILRSTPITNLFSFSLLQAAKLFIPFTRVPYIYSTSGLHNLLAD